jgi:hypothetical protein
VAVDVIERALRSRGLNVFRDKDIHLFDGITENLRQALDSCTVLLAFYSRRYPTRYACQWELTRAFLAAHRLGDVRDRILIVNPESDDRHIAPVEFTDAGYFSYRWEADVGRLADSVVDKVNRVRGPLGGVPGDDLAGLSEQLTVPRRFVGRYPEMWSVHSELHGGRLWGAHRPESHSAVVIKAPAGMGKTVLAEQYGFLFREAYPGGMVWTSIAGPEQVLGQYAAALNEVARARFGLDLSGLELRQAKATLADRITEDVLWVVDDVPEGLDPETVNQLIVPSPRVHTLMTARTAPAQWPCGQVTVGGLTTVEVEELFRAHWPGLSREDRAAIKQLVERCHGHPLEILPVVQRLRNAQGTGALELAVEEPRHSVVESLIEVIRARSQHARVVLGFAATLARAPISGDLLVDGVSTVLGRKAATLVAEALDELDEHCLLHRVIGAGRQAWQLHALVATAVRRDLDQVLMSSLAERAARVLLDEIADASLDTCMHALELAANGAVALGDRLSLLRGVAAAHEDRGDIPAARDARCLAVLIAGGEWHVEDAQAAARLAVSAGEATIALGYTKTLIDRARVEQDVRTEFQARLTAATAHDLLGRYGAADEVFHHHALVREHGTTPVWLSESDSQRTELARTRSLWLRGEYRAARQVIDGVLPSIQRACPRGTHRGFWPLATVELARLQLFTGQVIEARATAQKVISVFADAGVARHQLAREAAAVLAEGELTMAFSEMRGKPEQWLHATKRVRQACDESTEWYGADNPLTLDLMVLRGRTLSNNGEHLEALAVLMEAEQRIGGVLGAEHPLALRARQWIGLATMGRNDWKAAVSVFDQLLPRHVTVLGRRHPESQLTRFQLGACLLKLNDLKRARPLLHEAAPVLRQQQGPLQQWATMATVGDFLTWVPSPLLRFVNFLDRGSG